MRSVMSKFVVSLAIAVLSGCAGGEATSETTASKNKTDARPKGNLSEAADNAAEETTDPTILGVDRELQKEMRTLMAQFIEQQRMPGDAAMNLTRTFESAMLQIRRPATEFGIEADAAGNLDWPQQLQEEIIQPLRAEFDAKTLFDTYEIELPVWARPLLDECRADKISPVRREPLFRLASGEIIEIIKEMT
jgi:hypothetical protein